ncbi:hypothetical protein WJX72_000442 [[Myrmecia] bisecta]|uniref:Uncharacterized protein n=1 Tax=[Myrmecia] bisecta TaxID=41462 RepID=A0AAW1R4Q3_9CHLO
MLNWRPRKQSGKQLSTSYAAKLGRLETIQADDWRTLVTRTGSEAGAALLGLCRPQGPGKCDHSRFERVVNVVTSLPFVAIGYDTMKKMTTSEGKMYGASIMGVGAGAVVYHTSPNKYRNLGRKIDYWCIGLSSTALMRAVLPSTPPVATAAAIFMTPFQPFVVASANALAVEAHYLKRAKQRGDLKRAHQLHITTGVLGMFCFVLEEVYPKIPLVHTAWHGLSAFGMAGMNHLVADTEANRTK